MCGHPLREHYPQDGGCTECGCKEFRTQNSPATHEG